MYYFFIWRDIIEILLLSSLLYYIARWLKKDTQKNLLPYFFGYCLIALLAWTAPLPTIAYFVAWYTPAVLMLFMLMHQETLQRNLVALKNITPATISTDEDWLETLLSSCLVIINNNKEITCVIEHRNHLQNFLHAPLLINADLRKGILELLLESASYNHHKMIWVDTTGRLRAINASWSLTKKQVFADNAPLLQEALAHTTQTDALVFHINPVTRTFTIIAHGKTFDNVTAHHALQLIRRHIHSSKRSNEGDYHEATRHSHSSEQRTP